MCWGWNLCKFKFNNWIYRGYLFFIWVYWVNKKNWCWKKSSYSWKKQKYFRSFFRRKNEDIERLKNIQLDLHKDFIDVVEKSRGSKLNKSEVELFSGEFWSGSKAKDLGLIDGIGDAHQVLKEKFGNDVVIKKFEKSKGWLSQKLSSSNNQLDQLANILDERSIWQRYGF